MFHLRSFVANQQRRNNNEYHKRYHLLLYFELNKDERNTIVLKINAVGQILKHILKKSNTPAYQNNGNQSQLLISLSLVEFEMPILAKVINVLDTTNKIMV